MDVIYSSHVLCAVVLRVSPTGLHWSLTALNGMHRAAETLSLLWYKRMNQRERSLKNKRIARKRPELCQGLTRKNWRDIKYIKGHRAKWLGRNKKSTLCLCRRRWVRPGRADSTQKTLYLNGKWDIQPIKSDAASLLVAFYLFICSYIYLFLPVPDAMKARG